MKKLKNKKTYYLKRSANILGRALTGGRYFYRYSQLYSLTKGKLVSDTHDINDLVIAFGLKKIQKVDKKKLTYRSLFPTRAVPTQINYWPQMKRAGAKIRAQARQGSCTGQAGACIKDYHEINSRTFKSAMSAAYIYYKCRERHGWQNKDSGANMDDIPWTLANFGAPLARTMPYSQFDYTTKPSTKADLEAYDYRAHPDSVRVTVDEMKQVLLEKGPFVTGLPIPQSFSQANFNKGFVPTIYDTVQGLHAMAVVGHDDALVGPDGNVGYFILVNSWDTYVGDEGIYFIPYAWFYHYEGKNLIESHVQIDHPVPSPEPTNGDPEPEPVEPTDKYWQIARAINSVILTLGLLAGLGGAFYFNQWQYAPVIIALYTTLMGGLYTGKLVSQQRREMAIIRRFYERQLKRK